MRAASLAQYFAPQKTLSRIVRAATRWTFRPWKNFLIDRVVQRWQVDMTDAVQSDPHAYVSFNAFFTRPLRAGARRAEDGPTTIVCPADGRISQLGSIHEGRILQAKGRRYTATELLADEAAAMRYLDGAFATVYLSPRDCHRVYMPLAGTLLETVHVPGRLFSVAPGPVADIPRLFARNERLVCHFECEYGQFVVAMVGAMLVSGITTVWGGPEVPPYARHITRRNWRGRRVRLEKLADMGRFEMGSTVITLTSSRAHQAPLAAGQPIQAGQRLGTL
jgi:phosphatidylserine decarboxylase